MEQFTGKVALVTGGGSGIGEAISKELAAKGASVVVTDINLEAAQRVVKEISDAGGTASAVRQDTASKADAEMVVRHAVDTYGALHLAVNNAGIGGKQAPAGETDLDEWDKVIGINLNGVLYGMRYQIPQMLEAGAQRCAIVNMASIHGTVAALGNGAYTAAKHGVVGITKNAAAEYGPQGLRINSVGPGYIRTPLVENSLSPEILQVLEGKHALNRLVPPRKLPTLSASSCLKKRLSLPAAITWWTEAIPRSECSQAGCLPLEPADEGGLSQWRPLKPVHHCHVDRCPDDACRSECISHRGPDPPGCIAWPDTCEEDAQPVGFLEHLPTSGGNLVQYMVEHVGMDADRPGPPRQVEHILDPPFNVLHDSKGTSAGAAAPAQLHAVRHLVADEWQCSREQDSDEDLRPGCPPGHRYSFRVHGLDDQQVLIDVAFPVMAW
jgi:NAD(P)-dependent dehydrogenase (short-subunit alcohol dehydrogenase family)